MQGSLHLAEFADFFQAERKAGRKADAVAQPQAGSWSDQALYRCAEILRRLSGMGDCSQGRKQQKFRFAAAGAAAGKAGGHNLDVIGNKQAARRQKALQVREAAMGEAVGLAPIQHQQARMVPLRGRSLGYLRFRQHIIIGGEQEVLFSGGRRDRIVGHEIRPLLKRCRAGVSLSLTPPNALYAISQTGARAAAPEDYESLLFAGILRMG